MFSKSRRFLSKSRLKSRRGNASRNVSPCEFRLLFIVVASAVGVLVCGWLSSRLPAHYTAVAQVQRSFPASALQPSAPPALRAPERDVAKLLKEISAPASLTAVLRENPTVSAELSDSHPLEDLRSRITVGHEPLSDTSDRVWIRVAASTPNLARQLSGQLARQYAVRASRDNSTKDREECLVTAQRQFQKADAAWNVGQQKMRELEAEREFTRDDATSAQLARLREQITIARAQRDRIAQAIGDPRAQLSVTPALTNPVRGEPSLAQATLARYIERRDELAATFTPQHPAVLALERKISALAAESGMDNVATLVAYKTSSRSSVDQIETLQARCADLDQKISELEEQERVCTLEQEASQGAFKDRMLAAEQHADRLTVERANALREMQRLEYAASELRCTSAVHHSVLDRADSSVQFEGFRRRRWFLAGAFCWLSLTGTLAYLALRGRRECIA